MKISRVRFYYVENNISTRLNSLGRLSSETENYGGIFPLTNGSFVIQMFPGKYEIPIN